MSDKLAWGILGTGSIAGAFAKGVHASRRSTLAAVGSRSKDKAEKFGSEHRVPEAHRHATYEALLADPNVQAVYISTPHPMHAEWAIKSAEAGKHVLCEKPIGINHAEAMAIVEAARANGVFLMEAFMYRCHPQTAKLVELLREKVIGDVRVIQAAFSFHWPNPLNTDSRLTNHALAGGGILDVGCYPVSMSRLIAGAALGKDGPAEPIEIKGVGRVGDVSRVDEYAIGVLKFEGDIVSQISTGVQVNQENVVRIHGSQGQILIPSPWIPAREGGGTKIIVTRYGEKEPREITVETSEYLYGIEADTVAEAVRSGRQQAAFPAMSWGDTLGNMRTLDRWRQEIGLTYDFEKRENLAGPFSGRKLRVSPKAKMKYGRVAGVDKRVARLVMGVDNQVTMPHAAAMFDDYFERGGNAFDTAHIYAGGETERNFGQWVKARGVREQVFVIGKGAHTPNCNPKALGEQLSVSLERMQTPYVDLYMMHRDNPEIPAGEFIDALNGHVKAGRMKAFGGSNWSVERVQAANEYARSKGLQGFAAVSNNFSLARMVDAVWGGCIAASDPASRAWLEQHQLALFAWSSQARGFFLPHATPDYQGDPELRRCWYSDDNFRRRERAFELAKKKGVEPINIALAYVLHQPFPTFPLIGPRTIAEMVSSFRALEVELTPQEVKWLNLEA